MSKTTLNEWELDKEEEGPVECDWEAVLDKEERSVECVDPEWESVLDKEEEEVSVECEWKTVLDKEEEGLIE